ncbi:MAG: valine--tRNA ligase [Nevskia sp.]|nr:valine--tRNA ligase [Nevskia sp.]
MEKTFDPRTVEARWRDTWERNGWFAPQGDGAPYCIMIPPPNVTGTLHMGHAFQHTVMDALVRYHRMRGESTLWQPGTDHAGIATQMVVERNLKAQGSSRLDLGRERFVEKVWEWKRYSGDTITRQIRRMGNSVDWSCERFTMDEGYSKAVIEHFVRLHDEGLIYRGKRLVNWDPVLQTAISDLEVSQEEENGKLWHFRYPLVGGAAANDGKSYLVVATTRPETMLGDAAVAVHPEDERYKHLVGRKVLLPLCNREIPIIADDYVDREFGTGCVKITPAHDFNDYAMGQRHGLPLINIFTPTAQVNEAAPAAYRGLDRFEARKRIVTDLEGLQLVEKIEDHKLKVPRGDRTGVVLEPYLTDQWFVDLTRKNLPDGRPGGWTAITEPAIRAVEDGRIRFVPEGWSNTYFHWLRNIQDWCISRQLWWGHRIPAWYSSSNNAYVARSEHDANVRFRSELATASAALNSFANGTSSKDEMKLLQDFVAKHHLDEWIPEVLFYGDTGEVKTERKKSLFELTPGERESFAEIATHSIKTISDWGLHQDEDVFDTWFSSDIWPLATLGWPEETPELNKFYPTSVLVTGFDIIFFWVARMVMMGQKLRGQVPFREVYVHGLIRDSEGQKMSKSKGNVLDPLDLVDGITLEDLVAKRTTGLMKPETAPKIEKATRKDYPKGIEAVGVDALRFTFAALASPGRDIRFDSGRAAGYRNFCNKIWNATNYVLMNCQGQDVGLEPAAPCTLGEADRWIVSKLQKLEAEAAEHFRSYRFDLLAQALYQFVWNEYCDWYLELTKPALRLDDAAALRGTRRTLVRVLETLLRLLHPLIPFVTEDLWQQLAPLAGRSGPSIMLQPYPVARADRIDEAAEADVEWLKSFILGVRQIRSGMDIPPGKELPVLIQDAAESDVERLRRLGGYIGAVARVQAPRVLTPGETPPHSATALLGQMKILVPMAGLIDKEAESARLQKLIARTEGDLAKNEARLASDKFVSGAPAEVVEKERARVAQQKQELAALREQLEKILKL